MTFTLGARLRRRRGAAGLELGLETPTERTLGPGSSVRVTSGWLGGTGDYNKFDVDVRYYAPIATLGGGGQLGSGVQLVLGLTSKSGFVVGDAGPFYTELYTMGGVQYGIPLRGYEEFSITPDGFDPTAGGTSANVNSFGESYEAFTVEAGARLSQALYINLFLDAGNVYPFVRDIDLGDAEAAYGLTGTYAPFSTR